MNVILDETSCLVLSYAGFLRGLAQMYQNRQTREQLTQWSVTSRHCLGVKRGFLVCVGLICWRGEAMLMGGAI